MKLAELIAKYITAKSELDKAKSTCDSSWGYWLHDEMEQVDDLADQIDTKIVELVLERTHNEKQPT